MCISDWLWGWSHNTVLTMVGMCIPFATMITAYSMIIRSILKSRRQLENMKRAVKIKWYRISWTDVQLTKISFVICIVFMCCLIPITIVNCAMVSEYDLNITFNMFAMVCIFLNTVLDPLVYVLMVGPFKKELFRRFRMLMPRPTNI